jgi:hypothetical protein
MHHARTAYEKKLEVQLHAFLTSILDEDDMFA